MKKEKEIFIKVCGLNNLENIEELNLLQPDFMGFIFYEKSKRFFTKEIDKINFVRNLTNINKVGVFVNTDYEEIIQKVQDLHLQFVQLHGEETPAFCERLQKDVKVIKAFRLDDNFDFKITKPYLNVCEYFLFDCFTEAYGGSGQKFNWNQLQHFPFAKKYFLSGGIKPEDASAIKKLNLPGLFAVDVNSGFESAPGLKNIAALKTFMEQIKIIPNKYL